jgi:hypothetical protein
MPYIPGFDHSRNNYNRRHQANAVNTLRREQEAATKAEAWKVANPANWAWIETRNGKFDFASAMAAALAQWGSLTEKQHAAVTRCRERDEARVAAPKPEAASCDVTAILTAFDTAISRGIKSPKMRLGSFKFSLAKGHSINAGAVYVTADDVYLGKVMAGKFMRSFACTAVQEEQVVAVAGDPHKAAVAYGMRTGSCAICARTLTVGESIDRGIGPICAEKFGFA